MFNCENTAIICIDIQEKLVNMLQTNLPLKEQIVKNTQILMNAASVLNIDTIITEQYPKGLGATIDSIKKIKNFKTIEKTTFSALQTKAFEEAFLGLKKENIVIFGIETHICVYQTVIDLLEKKYNVYIPKDCCASRAKINHKTALELLSLHGANITTLEIILFDFLKSSKHKNFKEIQALIK